MKGRCELGMTEKVKLEVLERTPSFVNNTAVKILVQVSGAYTCIASLEEEQPTTAGREHLRLQERYERERTLRYFCPVDCPGAFLKGNILVWQSEAACKGILFYLGCIFCDP